MRGTGIAIRGFEMGDGESFESALSSWVIFHSAGKRPSTQRYHRELEEIIRKNWAGDLAAPVSTVTAADVAEFTLRVAHYSGPRFNALVSIFRSIAPAASRLMRRRPVSPKHVTLPGQEEFSALLVELDRAKHGNSGLVVRFLALTGLRIGEARRLTWDAVTPRGLLVPPGVTKNGRPRLIPFIGEIRSVLDRLRAVGDGARVLPQANARKALRMAARRAGLPVLSHHDLRRMFATRVIESGVDLPTAARWMGHSDGGALLAKTYFHLLDAHSEAMALRVKIAA